MPDGARPALYGMRGKGERGEGRKQKAEGSKYLLVAAFCFVPSAFSSLFIPPFLLPALEFESLPDGRGWPLSLHRCLDGRWLA